MLDTLFGLIPAESRGQQWVAEELQLVNWGGYDGGPHRVRFSPAATLLCGGSGSGKSTLMDAYIALMMPHTTPFNGASNGAVVGRPRGVEQRNILSYGRGKLDESRTEDGIKVRVLRGDGHDTWTAIAMTWLDHDGSRFTAVRAWYIPAAARVLEDTVRVRGTVVGPFDLRALEPAALHHLSDAAVRAAGLETVATDREFSARLHTTLGIGAAGAGGKAMSLLARIQAGQQISTVDDLYKRMVLEVPETLGRAEEVVAHFDELESTRNKMVTAQQQVRALAPIRDLAQRLGAAVDRMVLVDAVGRPADPASVTSLWRAERRLELLRRVEGDLRERKRAADAVTKERTELARAAEAEREALADVLRASGGDRLESAQRELRDVERRLAQVARGREKLDAVLAVLGEAATSAKQFAALSERAARELADPNAKAASRSQFADARSARVRAEADVAALEAERKVAASRRGNVPAPLQEARDTLARAVGVAAVELPFVGELIEVRSEFEPWRAAFNLALGGFATTVLLDSALLPRFREAINDQRLSVRLQFEGVHTGLARRTVADTRTLPARLDFEDSPFAGWLQDRLTDRFNFVCVDSPAELGRYDQALTISGQTAQRNRGAHGGQGRANVLGFSNQHRLADLAGQIDRARAWLVETLDDERLAEQRWDAADARRDAQLRLSELTWDEVDVATLEQERQRWADRINDLTAGNPRIAELQAQIVKAKDKQERLQQDVGRARAAAEEIDRRRAEVIDGVDADQEILDAAREAGREVASEHARYLDEQFEAPDEADGDATKALARFDAALASASHRLAEDREAVQSQMGDLRGNLRLTMATFLERWPNPNLYADPDTGVADFERILTELESSGLHTLEKEWRDSLLMLSGNDLTDLDSTLGRALREIRERINPINEILGDLPFYDDEHRLQITTRENQSDVRRRFRAELRAVREAIDAAASDADRDQAYARMSRLIARIRPQAPDFADLIDVRNHVRVSAERIHATTLEHVALYDHIGEKSGGESQELIAFIVGAALRYQLGDAGASRPRYAPVLLDEALIKADAHFTKRAIGAWRGLGFQLIIGAPNDKYSAIEPHVDVEYDILKDTLGRSWAKLKVGLPVQG